MRCAIAFVAMLGGCMHPIPWAPHEQCAARGMVLDGMAMSSASASGLAVGNGGWATSSGYAYGESVSCHVPRTAAEVCEAKAAQASLSVKADYSIGGRNLLIGIGWFAFVVPGLVLYVVFDRERDGIAEDATKAAKTTLSSCIRQARPDEGGVAEPSGPSERSPPARGGDDRAIVFVSQPAYCAVQRENSDVGACFVQHAACDAERSRLGETYLDCTERASVACFYATGTLDEQRIMLCSVSIKDCEAKRQAKAADPDFSHVDERCRIRRVRASNDRDVEDRHEDGENAKPEAAVLPTKPSRFCFDKVPKTGGDKTPDCSESMETCKEHAAKLGMLWNPVSACEKR